MYKKTYILPWSNVSYLTFTFPFKPWEKTCFLFIFLTLTNEKMVVNCFIFVILVVDRFFFGQQNVLQNRSYLEQDFYYHFFFFYNLFYLTFFIKHFFKIKKYKGKHIYLIVVMYMFVWIEFSIEILQKRNPLSPSHLVYTNLFKVYTNLFKL